VLCRRSPVTNAWELSTQHSAPSTLSAQPEERASCAPVPSSCSSHEIHPETGRTPGRNAGLFGSPSRQPGRQIPLPSPATQGAALRGRLSNNFPAKPRLLRGCDKPAAPRLVLCFMSEPFSTEQGSSHLGGRTWPPSRSSPADVTQPVPGTGTKPRDGTRRSSRNNSPLPEELCPAERGPRLRRRGGNGQPHPWGEECGEQ